MKKMRVIDFFCGAGGFSEGFRQAGYEIVMGIDNWAPAIKTHNLNHGLNDSPRSVLEFEDIEKIHQLPDSEIIVGSPPCVSFSLSNKGGNADKSLGIRLIEAYLRVIAVKKHQPESILKAWLMENVPNSKNYVKESYTFRDLSLGDWAKKIGKDPDSEALSVKNNGDILKASDYGAAQARKRFVCGEMTNTGKFPQPSISNEEVNVASIRKFLPAPLSNPIGTVIDPNYPSLKILAEDLTDHYYDTGVYEIDWQRARAAKTNHPYMGKMSFPENESKPSRTIMATRSASTREAILYKSEVDRSGNGAYRMPTVREAASLMGFPITYVFFGNEATKWRQIGNAVCPQMARFLANKILDDLSIHSNQKISFNISIPKDGITYLDDNSEKAFDTPPKRNSKALFRNHPIKSGNMTVALTNKDPASGDNEWSVMAFMGTGKQYKSVKISTNHKEDARLLLSSHAPKFIEFIEGDSSISHRSQEQLSVLNSDYHYNDENGEHPLSLINKIGRYIEDTLQDTNDTIINTTGTLLESIKTNMPLSQIMAIYSVGKIVHPEN